MGSIAWIQVAWLPGMYLIWWWWWSGRWQKTCPREFGREEHISGRWIQPEVVKVTRSKRKIFKISIILDVKTKFMFLYLPINSTWLCQWKLHFWRKKKKSPAFLEAHLSCLCPSFPLEWCSTEVVPCRPELWWQWCWWCWLWWWWWW